ncbi:MAG: RluA family pseudouridine synthase [bacterium]
MPQGKNTTIWTVSKDKAGKRLDICLAQLPFRISRSQWKRLIEEGFVKIGGHVSAPSHILRIGEIIEITIPEPEPLEIEPEKIALDIIYEDDSLLIINKPAGMVVHPGAGHSSHTLVNALLHHCPDLAGIGGKKRPGIVHRLDKDTSGLLAVAKTEWAHISLSSQLKKKQVQRVYLALVHGIFPEDEGQIHTLIGRHPVYRQKMSINVRTGRDAITNWRVKERFSHFTWMELRLQTGRTHQIRVHMSHLGYPVVGDKVYGRGKIPKDCPLKLKSAIAGLTGQALHAHSLGFNHPCSGKYMEFHSPPPMSIQKILNILKT